MLRDDLVAERVRGLLERHGGAARPDDDPCGLGGRDPCESDEGLPFDGGGEDLPDGRRAGAQRTRAVAGRRAPKLAARLAARVPVRLDPGHRAAMAVGVAVLVAAVITGAWLLAARPRALPMSAATPIAGAQTPQGSQAVSAGSGAGGSVSGRSAVVGHPGGPVDGTPAVAELVVDVAGKVRHPGVYHLPAQSRVADAVAAAGGATHGVDLTSVNLAARLTDGQQIVVGRPGVAAGAAGGAIGGGGPAGASSTTGVPVNLNFATLEQLESLPGIGPALGQRILDWRTEHGSFSTVDQLKDVSGIGDAKFAAMKRLVVV